MYMIIIKVDCCGRPQTLCGLSVWTSSDAMRAKGLMIVLNLKETPTCIVGDFNEDISIACKRHCCSMLALKGFKQMVKRPTTDSGALIDHVYVSQEMTVTTDVTDCYYTDHDYVLGAITI